MDHVENLNWFNPVSCLKSQYFNNASFSYIHAFHWLHCSLHSFLEIQTVNIVIKPKEHALQRPYQTRARSRVMGEVEEVQKQMKADMEAMKEQMATMMEAMVSMKKIMEANAVAVAATSAVAKVNPMPPSGLNQMNHPTSAMVGKDLGSTSGPYYVQIQNKHAFPPYGLPPNYTPPNVAYTPSENINNSTPLLIESRQPQTDHAHVSQTVGKHMKFPTTI